MPHMQKISKKPKVGTNKKLHCSIVCRYSRYSEKRGQLTSFPQGFGDMPAGTAVKNNRLLYPRTFGPSALRRIYLVSAVSGG
jgi:hypothetical protein